MMKTTVSIDNNGIVTAISKAGELPIELTKDCPFYFDWSQAQFYKYDNGNWVEKEMTEFIISKVDYDWGSQASIITLANGDVLTFECTTTWDELDCINAVKSTARYKNAINI